MLRCAHCRFLFDAVLVEPSPECPQCGQPPIAVERIEPEFDAPDPPPTLKFVCDLRTL